MSPESQFGFLIREWPAVAESAVKAEAAMLLDVRTSSFLLLKAFFRTES